MIDGKHDLVNATRDAAIIEAVLKETRGPISGLSGAAMKLGIPRTTLESKIKSLHINKHEFKCADVGARRNTDRLAGRPAARFTAILTMSALAALYDEMSGEILDTVGAVLKTLREPTNYPPREVFWVLKSKSYTNIFAL